MSALQKFASVFYALIFVATSVMMVLLGNYPGLQISASLAPMTNVIYAWHLGCWMVLGMVANYLWDLFRSGKSVGDISFLNLGLPILVSPIVFYGMWSLVPKSTSSGLAAIDLTWALVAFQNGFFWQVVFSKAGPVGPRVPPAPP